MIHLTKRLAACADYVRPDSRVCDIGTDHAYLPCFLTQHGNHPQITAADVHEKPLETARRHIIANGCADTVSTVLSDGLADIPPEWAEDIIIAGMGGELILRILLDCPWLAHPEKRLILQPMSQAPELRKGLYANAFCIEAETPVAENGHHYTVMLCRYAGTAERKDALFCLTGKIAGHPSPDAVSHLLYQAGRMQKIADGIAHSAHFAERQEEAEHYRRLSAQIRALTEQVRHR